MFSTEQQEYLKGFMFGVEARRAAAGLPLAPAGQATDPNDIQRAAQDATTAAGGKLTPEEEAKRKKHPLLRFDELSETAKAGLFPKGTDVFLTKFFGLFYVAPAQNSYMCRLRIPGGILSSHQLAGIASIADDLAGGYADITTRANLQLREIPATAPPEVIIRLNELGLTSRGSGADNIRNVTGSPTAGLDPQELLDTRPHTRAMHHYILHHPELYGLPRKFNIAYDGGGSIPVLEDTNDIAFSAVQTDEGIFYRLGLGGITGHKDFAHETNIIIPPDETIPVANAILRVFSAEGNRTDRTKARLKYVLDRMGLDTFIEKVEAELGHNLNRATAIHPRPPQNRTAHIGIHKQKDGRNYIGVLTPVGRLASDQLRGIAQIANRYGTGEIRLTVWQNLIIPNIADSDRQDACAAIESLGLHWQASNLRTGLVACTGNAGCKFAASNTKAHATALVDYLEPRIAIDTPINIHLTGCHHSCAQHYISDFGLLAAKVERGEDMLEGYDLHVGGGAGPDQAIGRLIRPGIVFDDLPPMMLALLQAYANTKTQGETFLSWTATQSDEALHAITETA